MANSRIMLVCKHCGKGFCIGKGDLGSYRTINEHMFEDLNAFYDEHKMGECSDDIDCSDEARNHFIILDKREELKDYKEEYDKGYEQGVKDLADRLIKYYGNLRSGTYSGIVTYTTEVAMKELLGKEKDNDGG